ncbi:transcriptional regulator CsgD [Enterobacteriaceae bacterium RIT691]|nr:transcriptional regulator CsgD [Enterobacteriaceae bacterium RIT691]
MNIDDRERGKTLSEWPSLSDIFYRSDSQLHVHARIKETVNTCRHILHDLTTHLFPSPQRDAASAEEGEQLTVREKQILRKLCEGATNSDIACSLFISEHTVRTHIYNLFKKIKVKNRTQAVFWAADKLEDNESQETYS